MIRTTSLRLQSLDAPSTSSRDANPSLQRHNNNLGTRKGGVTCGVGRHSIRSLHSASLDTHRMARSFPDLDRVAPALRKGSLSEQAPPQQFAGEEGTNKLSEDKGLCAQTPPRHFALEEGTTKLTEVPPQPI